MYNFNIDKTPIEKEARLIILEENIDQDNDYILLNDNSTLFLTNKWKFKPLVVYLSNKNESIYTFKVCFSSVKRINLF